jgi:hypothetical protein
MAALVPVLVDHEATRPHTKPLLVASVLPSGRTHPRAQRYPERRDLGLPRPLDDVPHPQHGPVGHPNLWRYLTGGHQVVLAVRRVSSALNSRCRLVS